MLQNSKSEYPNNKENDTGEKKHSSIQRKQGPNSTLRKKSATISRTRTTKQVNDVQEKDLRILANLVSPRTG